MAYWIALFLLFEIIKNPFRPASFENMSSYIREKMLKPRLDDFGLNKSLTPRSCRKTGISLIAENSSISDSIRIKIAGHTDVAVEEKHYIEMESKRLREAINKLQTFSR